ncbi:MAG: NUDIX domain-containing protein [Oscillospiraceae bacterium]|nr:NUDIX domain-containing protein [Oscillospiraceae bacterium]
MNVFLTGEVQVGKSTLINKLIASAPELRYAGFRSVSVSPRDSNALADVIIQSVHKHRLTEPNRVGIRWGRGIFDAFPENFEGAGVEILSSIPECDLIIMDEIGTMESKAVVFSQELLELMDGDSPVLGVIKPINAPLLDSIRRHYNTAVLEVNKRNREMLDREIRDTLFGVPGKLYMSCGAVVLDCERNVLLIQSGDGHWSFPKGHCEAGESELAAAVREVREETDQIIVVDAGFKLRTKSVDSSRWPDSVFYLASPKGSFGQEKTDECYSWHKAERAIEMLKYDSDRYVLQRALEYRYASV